MAHNSARQQLIEWLEHQLSGKQQELTEAEAQIAKLRASIEQTKADIAFLEQRLFAETSVVPLEEVDSERGDLRANGYLPDLRESENNGESVNSTNNWQEVFEDEDLDLEKNGVHEPAKRNPKEMMRAEFTGMTLGDAAQKIMEAYRYPMSTKQVAETMFETNSEDEALRAKNSLSTELRRGANEGRWQKRERGLFALNSYLPQLEMKQPEL